MSRIGFLAGKSGMFGMPWSEYLGQKKTRRMDGEKETIAAHRGCRESCTYFLVSLEKKN